MKKHFIELKDMLLSFNNLRSEKRYYDDLTQKLAELSNYRNSFSIDEDQKYISQVPAAQLWGVR